MIVLSSNASASNRQRGRCLSSIGINEFPIIIPILGIIQLAF